MKTIRLLYPDHRSGGLDTYYFGANLLQHILPRNDNQPLVKVDIAPPDGKGRDVTDGIYAKDEVLAGIRNAQKAIEAEAPDRIITIGGNCLVSLDGTARLLVSRSDLSALLESVRALL